MKWKLGLDMGSTSIGWAAVELNNTNQVIGLIDLGVRIFPDGRDAKKHTPINVERRNARGMRRRGDRVKLRKQKTAALLKKYGLEFSDYTDPYALRAAALERKLSQSELGRVFFHLALRRGFKSNRKDLRKEGGGKLKAATDALEKILEGKTLGAAQACGAVKLRFSNQFDGNKIKDGAFYPTRKMYEDEFNAICDAQKIPAEMRGEFHNAIFYQRPLKPQDVGFCIFEPDQPRAYKYEPAFQKWRSLQQLNQLRIMQNGEAVALTPEQMATAKEILLETFAGVKKGKITFAELKKQLGLRNTKFNLESDKRDSLDADKTGFAFHKIGVSPTNEIIAKIADDKIEDDELITWLTAQGFDESTAEKIANIDLEDDTANVSLFAINKMLPFLEADQMYHEAAKSAGYHHSDTEISSLDELPYYGDVSVLRSHLIQQKGIYKTTNATVHIALNQLRDIVNGLIRKHGKPAAINVEMARDLRSGAEELTKINSDQAKNKKENDKIREELTGIGIANPSREDIQKYKLWERLAPKAIDRCCVYTGQQISLTALYSNQFEIEHILPFAQTLDDSMANKTVSSVDANRFKGNRAPFDAFNDPASPWKYEDVLARAQKLPDATKWRFNKGALESYLKDGDCIARALNDTRHMTRIATIYLKHICEDKNNVAGLPGKMTALFREMWSLDWWKGKADAEHYRGHHIHHAIDAFVVACMGIENLRKIATNATNLERFGKSRKEKQKELFADIPLPFGGFDHYKFYAKCENTNISYRPDNKDPRAGSTVGQLHQDTSYNLEEFQNGTKAKFSCRESLPANDKDKDKFKKNFKYLNPKTLEMFLRDTGARNDDEKISGKFLDWAAEKNIKKIRMIYPDIDATTYIPVFRTRTERDEFRRLWLEYYKLSGRAAGTKAEKIAQKEQEDAALSAWRDAAKKAYKWFVSGNNFQAEVYEIREDDKRYPKLRGAWQIEIMSNYNAQLDGGQPFWKHKFPAARRVMSLRANDIVRAEFSRNDEKLPKGIIEAVRHKCEWKKKDKVEINFRVKKLNSSGVIYLRPDWIAKEEADTKCWLASAGSLKEHNARKVFVSPLGELK